MPIPIQWEDWLWEPMYPVPDANLTIGYWSHRLTDANLTIGSVLASESGKIGCFKPITIWYQCIRFLMPILPSVTNPIRFPMPRPKSGTITSVSYRYRLSWKFWTIKCPRAKKCDLITLSKLYIGTITLLKMPFITSWKFNHFVSKLDLK